jgi:hypothetical protein
MGAIKDFFLGELKTAEIDIGDAKAVIEDDNGNIFTFTRKGYHKDYGRLGIVAKSGEERLHSYISENKLQVLSDDNGEMVPVCKIKKITITKEPKILIHSWR